MTLGLRSIATTLSFSSLLALGPTGCVLLGGDDAADDGAGGSTGGAATGDGSPCSDGPGATSSVASSGYEPCGTGGCWTSGSQTSGYTSGSWTSGEPTSGGWTSGWATGASDGGDHPGPLITTGNEDATEWDVTVLHVLDGEAPVEDTYLTTTVVHMETDFYSITAVPVGLGSTIYIDVDGDHSGGVVTNLQGGFGSVAVEGTIQISDVLLDGSGTLHDWDTGEQIGTWEITDAVPHP